MAMTISDAARMSGVSAHTLRSYERAGLLDPVERDDASGHRRFTEGDLVRVEEAQRTLDIVDYKIDLYRKRLT